MFNTPDNGQITHLISSSQDWVGEHGTQAATDLTPQEHRFLASQGWVVDQVTKRLALPLAGVAVGLGYNATVQLAKWLLGG